MFVKSVITPERGNVVVTLGGEGGGEERFFISRALWQRFVESGGVHETDAINEETYDMIALMAEKTSALKEGSRIIGGADRSTAEVARKLKIKKFSDEAIKFALSVLKKNGYLDEASNCVRIAERELRSKHYGKRRILSYLLSHGYGSEAAEEAVNGISDEEYRDALRYNVERKFPDIAEADRGNQQKAIASLMRLGFEISDILGVIKELK